MADKLPAGWTKTGDLREPAERRLINAGQWLSIIRVTKPYSNQYHLRAHWKTVSGTIQSTVIMDDDGPIDKACELADEWLKGVVKQIMLDVGLA